MGHIHSIHPHELYRAVSAELYLPAHNGKQLLSSKPKYSRVRVLPIIKVHVDSAESSKLILWNHEYSKNEFVLY